MATSVSQATFYQEFLMGRAAFNPRDYGVDMDREAFDDLMVEAFHAKFRDSLSLDDLLLRPQLALTFCAEVKMANEFYDVPDDIILRAIMIRRKNP